ncbi:UbiA prenyltransferase family domain-containing protein [Trichoderma sp. SZMC 28012]
MGGVLSRVVKAPLPLAETVPLLMEAAILGLLCNYIFDIANQTSSPDEDYINKPDRPIPAGLMTIEQAKTRWVLTWVLGPVTLYSLFGVWPTMHLLHWEALITVCYVWPKWFGWFMRSYFGSFSYCILGRILNSVLARDVEAWNISFTMDCIIFAWLMGTMHIQEFHDLEGDRKSERKTLPMLLSDRGIKVLRAGTSLFVLAFGTCLCYIGYTVMDKDIRILPLCILQQLLSSVLAYRIYASDGPAMDKKTYRVYYYGAVLAILLCLCLIEKRLV